MHVRCGAGEKIEITSKSYLLLFFGRRIYRRGTVVDTITTDENGVATSRPLRLGRYELVETGVPFGFIASNPIPVTIGFDGQLVDEYLENHVSIFNERQRATVILDKIMEMPDNPVDGFNPYQDVRFGLFSREDIRCADGEVIISAGSLIEIFGVDDNGRGDIKADLPLGNFFIRELRTSIGYILDETEYDVNFDYAPEKGVLIEIAVNDGNPIVNRLIRGNVRLIKLCSSTNQPLAGAEFTLYDPHGNVVGVYVTNRNGEIFVQNLPYGVGYRWVETKAPEGFQISEGSIPFDITQDGVTIELNAKNDRIPEQPQPPQPFPPSDNPKTGDDSNMALWLALMGGSAVALIGLRIAGKRKKMMKGEHNGA